jgi:hypothetical protein
MYEFYIMVFSALLIMGTIIPILSPVGGVTLFDVSKKKMVWLLLTLWTACSVNACFHIYAGHFNIELLWVSIVQAIMFIFISRILKIERFNELSTALKNL